MRLLSLLLVALTSCIAGSAGEVVPVAPPESCLTGTVSAVGTDFDPGTILRPDDGQEIRIAGEEESRIQVLSGTVVTVCGELTTDARDVSTIEAQSFELRAVDGMTAYLGTLQEVDGGWQLKPERSGADPRSHSPVCLSSCVKPKDLLSGSPGPGQINPSRSNRLG